jgi:very-short-patch-repair endonuclease
MPRRFIVEGQRVDGGLADRAREFRRAPTLAERVLWQELRGRRLAGLRFRRQQIIDGYIADFYCHESGLVVEVDGPIHETQREQDAVRDEYIIANDLRILRVTNDDVLRRLPQTLERIAKAAIHKPD